MKPYIFLRALRHADHTVFCVQDGQKTYYDQQFDHYVAYSSGQQVKRSVLEELISGLNIKMAPATFNYEITNKSNKSELKQKAVWTPCDPSFVDQLIGGWMKAKSKKKKKKEEDEDEDDNESKDVLKRRSPLSISAMRPLHPLLGAVNYEKITFDRSQNPESNPVIVTMDNKRLSEKEIEEFLNNNNRTLPRHNWINNKKNDKGFGRASGLFIYDIAIDLRTLFSVSTNLHVPELTKEKIDELKNNGWVENENIFGKCLTLPKEQREKVIPALAKALINWKITSNQARTFSLMETLAIAISDNANTLAGAIRAKLIDDGEKPKAKPIIDETAGADLFVTLPCSGYVVTETESASAIQEAEQKLTDLMLAFDYEKQL